MTNISGSSISLGRTSWMLTTCENAQPTLGILRHFQKQHCWKPRFTAVFSGHFVSSCHWFVSDQSQSGFQDPRAEPLFPRADESPSHPGYYFMMMCYNSSQERSGLAQAEQWMIIQREVALQPIKHSVLPVRQNLQPEKQQPHSPVVFNSCPSRKGENNPIFKIYSSVPFYSVLIKTINNNLINNC